MEKETTFNVSDWVYTRDRGIVKITHDDMADLPYEQILRRATREELKEEIFKKRISIEDAPDVLDKRMYIFVPYNISDIQKGIQAGHAVEQYAYKYHDDVEYMDFVQNHKTWIILNGGITNNDDYYKIGSLNSIESTLKSGDVKYASFYEPDLNNALTAVCFLCDERVFNWVQYPDYHTWCLMIEPHQDHQYSMEPRYKEQYDNFVGGASISLMKELIHNKKLA